MADLAASAGHAAGKAGGKMGDLAPLLIAAALIGGAIYVYSQSTGTSGYQIVGATNNSSERAAIATANATAAQAHEANILTGFGQLVGEATTMYNDNTQVTLGDQSLQASIAQLKAQTNIAALQDSASEAQSTAALQAAQAQAHAAQQNGLWSSIAGIFSSGLSAFTGGLGGGSSRSNAAPNAGSFGSWG